MDIYHIFADHSPNTDAYTFVKKMSVFLDSMVKIGKMEKYRIMRMKLGFRSMALPEFHIMMEFKNMQQLDDAMTSIIRNEKNIDESHVSFNSLVDKETIQHFLYRDFPDDLNNPKLTNTQKEFTINDVVEATKNIKPDLW